MVVHDSRGVGWRPACPWQPPPVGDKSGAAVNIDVYVNVNQGEMAKTADAPASHLLSAWQVPVDGKGGPFSLHGLDPAARPFIERDKKRHGKAAVGSAGAELGRPQDVFLADRRSSCW